MGDGGFSLSRFSLKIAAASVLYCVKYSPKGSNPQSGYKNPHAVGVRTFMAKLIRNDTNAPPNIKAVKRLGEGVHLIKIIKGLCF